MKTEKIMLDGKEIEIVTEVDEEEIELALIDQKEDLEKTLDLNNIVDEVEGEEENE